MTWFTRRCRSDARLDGKTAIVTGSNTGIGRATAKELAARGARVILAVRDVSRGEKAAADIRVELEQRQRQRQNEKNRGTVGDIVVQQLDLASLSSVRDCASRILDSEAAIHLLVNNAAVMCTPRTVTEDGFELQLGVNYLGHFLFTLLLLPRIRTSAPARIVVVGSASYTIARLDFDDLMCERSYSKFGAYTRSKLATMLFSRELARRLKEVGEDGVTTYCVHPGVLVATELSRHFDSFIMPGTTFFIDKVGKHFVRTPKQGAQSVIHCAVEPALSGESGLYYSNCRAQNPSPRGRDDLAALELWQRSLRLCGLEQDAGFKPLNAAAEVTRI